jgi:hypothetical protein
VVTTTLTNHHPRGQSRIHDSRGRKERRSELHDS